MSDFGEFADHPVLKQQEEWRAESGQV